MAVYQSEFPGATIDARLAAVATMQTAISNLETAVAAKYSKPSSGIPETDMEASVQAALALARTAVQSLSDYYTKAQVDDITAAIAASVDSTSGVVVATLPSAGAGTLGKMYYVGPDANGFYDRYVTSYDGSTYSWLALGNTEVDMTQYATVDELNQLEAEVNDVIPEVVEDGLYLVDSDANIGYHFGVNGITGPTTIITALIMSLIETIFATTAEDGFYIVDENRNIGFMVNASGAHSANLVEY